MKTLIRCHLMVGGWESVDSLLPVDCGNGRVHLSSVCIPQSHGSTRPVTMVTGTGSEWWGVWREREERRKGKKRPPAVFHQQPKGNLAKETGDDSQLPASCNTHAALSHVHPSCSSCFYPCTLQPSPFPLNSPSFLLLSLSTMVMNESWQWFGPWW